MPQSLPGFILDLQSAPADLLLNSTNQLILMNSESRVPQESRLVLRPGEFSQILIHLSNQTTQSLNIHLDFQVEDYFLSSWFKIRPAQIELDSGENTYASLDFQLPENFFEQPNVIPNVAWPKLEYQGYLCAWSTHGDQVEFLDSKPLKFAVRPRSLYLSFLPELYNESDFMGRFISIFEKTFEPTVQMLENMWAYLNPLTAPESLIPFLAAWVAWPMNSQWDLAQQRQLIQNAVEVYRWRGTRRGLRLYLHLYTELPLDEHLPESEKHISIEEVFTEGFILNSASMGIDTMLGGSHPFHFLVRLRSESPNKIDIEQVQALIEREKPAFCTFELYIDPINPSVKL
jgi:phage tail-like protein